MKKLMTMIAAVATAFGLFAADTADIAGINSFDSSDAGVDGAKFTPAEAEGWSFTGTETELDLDEYAGDEYTYPTTKVAGNVRRTEFKSPSNAQFLKLETGKEVLSLAAGDSSIFADQVVKFTGFEEAPTLADNTKIAVWMSEEWNDDESEAVTNLYVSAYNAEEGVTNYLVGAANQYELGKWYRLTIKSLGNIMGDGYGTRNGFVVYIDGELAASSEAELVISAATLKDDATKALAAAGQLFPAITTDATFASVGYMGIGSVDDVVVDDQGPEFARKIPFTVAGNEMLAFDTIKDSEGNDVVPSEGVANGTKVIVTWIPNAGYKILGDKKTTEMTITEQGQTIEPGEDIDVEEVVAKLNNTTDLAESELAGALAALGNGDVIATILPCGVYTDDDEPATIYAFTPNTTITGTENGWTIYVGSYTEEEELVSGTLEFNGEVAAGKTVAISFDADLEGQLTFGGAVAGALEVANGTMVLATDITLANGASIKAAAFDFDTNFTTITLQKGAEVKATENEIEEIVADDDLELKVTGPVDDYYTYTAVESAPESGFMVIIAAGGTKGPFDTLAEAVEAAEAGDTVQLLDDQTVTGICAITKSITLDLNGNTLSKDTTEVNYKSKMIVVQNGATLTVDGTDEGSMVKGGIYAGVTATSFGTIIVNGGTYYPADGKADCAFSSNGNAQTEPGNAITINNAEVYSPNDIAIYLAGLGTYEINNSKVEGYTAIYQKAGTLAIDATSVITATGDTYVAPKSNTNGAYTTGDAIVLDSNAAYAGAVELTIASGATVTKKAEGAAVIRETVTSGNASATLSIDPGDVTDIAVTDSFAEKVAEGKAQLPGFVAVAGGKPYTSLNDAFAAATDGTTITMLDDVTLSARIFVGKDVTLDLAGKKIEWNTSVANGSGVLIVCRDAELTIDDSSEPSTGVIDAKGKAYAAVALTHSDDPKNSQTDLTASLVVNGGSLIGYHYGIVGNGKRPNTYIAINGGLVKGTAENDSAGIYHPQAGTLVLNGGTIEGATGVYAKAGDCECTVASAVTIKGVGDKSAYEPCSNGFYPTGDAIVFDTCGYPGGAPDPTIAGGTFVSENGAAIASYADPKKPALAPVANFVTGGTFTGHTAMDNALAGGSFAFPPFVADQPQQLVPAVASVNGVNFSTAAEALAAVQALEGAGDFPIVAKALVADLAIVGPNNQQIVLAKDETVTIGSGSWEFSSGVTINGTDPIALAEGATFTVVGQIAGYTALFSAPEGFSVKEIANSDGTYTYTTEKIKYHGNYEIWNKEDFVQLQTDVAAGETFAGKTFTLINDVLDLTDWEGIGQNSQQGNKVIVPFEGVFNGNGKKISVTYAGVKNYTGLFNCIQGGAVISNLTIKASLGTIKTEDEFGFAGLVGEASGDATIANVTITADSTIGTEAVPLKHNGAGIAVYCHNPSGTVVTFKDCVNNASVYTQAGKAAGFLSNANGDGDVVFVNCVNNGAVTSLKNAGDNGIGGFIGYDGAAGARDFTDCTNTGAMTATGIGVGSFVGFVNSNSYATSIEGNTAQAGMLAIGKVKGSKATCSQNFKYATVPSDVATFVADNALAAGNTYKVMAPSVSPVLELTVAGQTVSFNTNLVEVASFDGITVADGLDRKETAEGGIVTFTAAAPLPDWPDLPAEFPADADDAVKAKYADWATTYNVKDPAGKSAAFLMNVDPEGTIPELKIKSIAVEGNVATIVVTTTGEAFDLSTINGVLFVSATDDLAGEWTTTAVAEPTGTVGNTATFSVSSANFMKAKVGFKVETPVNE